MAIAARATGRSIPALRGRIFIGNFSEARADRLGLYERILDECGPVGSFRYGPVKLVVIADPEVVQGLLVEHAADIRIPKAVSQTLERGVGKGLVGSDGEYWRRHRTLMAPAFAAARVARRAETTVTHARELQASWRDGQLLSIDREMDRLAMRIIGKALFGRPDFGEREELGAAAREQVRYVADSTTKLLRLPLLVPTKGNRAVRKANRTFRRHVQAMIDERRGNGGGGGGGDVLSLLMIARDESGQGMSDDEVIAECATLFLAGHEATTAGLTWTYSLLGRHPEAQQRLLAEIDGVLQGRVPTPDDLARLPYTLQVVKEALRLYPSAPSFLRQARRELTVAGYTFTQNMLLVFSPYSMHRRSDFYGDPERFDPDRFAPDNERKLPRYAYMPFGAGSRTCIGDDFALMEARLVLATLAQEVTLELERHQVIESRIRAAVLPKDGIAMRVRRRARASVA